jgi:hypothetical protein
LNPLEDTRWDELLKAHPSTSVFHSRAWLEALRRTYNYAAVAFTTSPPDVPLKNAIVLSKVKSWITGSRMVSVAFGDDCQPLVSNPEELQTIVSAVQEFCREQHNKYVEFRWINTDEIEKSAAVLTPEVSYQYHSIDLRPELDTLFHAFHKSCIQRKIRRAEKEELQYEIGTSDSMLQEFYRLMILTRRRHGLPPQPFAWFRNLRDCFGDDLRIRIARKDGRALASILTLQDKQSLVYKYGCSDAGYHHLGSMPWLFWQTIQEAKRQSLLELDLGRSDIEDQGLIDFKNHLGAHSLTLTNYRYYPRVAPRTKSNRLHLNKKSCEYVPPIVLRAVGTLLYRHLG